MRWTLRTKWTLAVLAVGIVPLGVLGGVVLELQRSGLARAEKELEAAVVDEAAYRVVADLDRLAQGGARAGKLLGDDGSEVDARIRAIRDVVARSGALTGVGIFDADGRFVDAVVEEGKDDPALHEAPARAGFEVLPDGRVRWAGPIQGAVQGSVVLALAPGHLDEQLRSLSLARFGAPDRVYLVDAGRRAIAGRGRGEPLPIFERPMPTSFSAELVLTTELVDRGVAKVATLRTIPAHGLALVVERPTEEAFAALARTRRALAVSLGAFVLLAAAAGLLVARSSLRPIGSLMDLVRRYAKREFRARSGVRSGDELEQLGASLERMADDLAASEDEIAKRAQTEANLRRYLPAEAAEAAANGAKGLDLGGAKRSVTVVFADVVAFTGFAERTAPDRSVAFLNELFTILSEVVFRHGGMVDKFIGDCVMAVFRDEGHVERALAAAEDMHAFVASNLPRWRSEYSFDVELGIGVATGEVLLGNLGSESRMEYTVIGDAVNVASRLEALARPRQTLATREVKEAATDFRFTSLGEHALRGKAQPVEVFEVVA